MIVAKLQRPRLMGQELDRLRAEKTAILVVFDETELDGARTVVTSRLCTIMVTDEATAAALLEEQ